MLVIMITTGTNYLQRRTRQNGRDRVKRLLKELRPKRKQGRIFGMKRPLMSHTLRVVLFEALELEIERWR